MKKLLAICLVVISVSTVTAATAPAEEGDGEQPVEGQETQPEGGDVPAFEFALDDPMRMSTDELAAEFPNEFEFISTEFDLNPDLTAAALRMSLMSADGVCQIFCVNGVI